MVAASANSETGTKGGINFFSFKTMSIAEIKEHVDSVQDLSSAQNIHLKILLDRGVVVPNPILGKTLESLRGVVSRNQFSGIILRAVIKFL